MIVIHQAASIHMGEKIQKSFTNKYYHGDITEILLKMTFTYPSC
jgi:hypothetical protein